MSGEHISFVFVPIVGVCSDRARMCGAKTQLAARNRCIPLARQSRLVCVGLVDVAYEVSATHGFRALGFTDYAVRCAGFKV